jgi:hypothetical protein
MKEISKLFYGPKWSLALHMFEVASILQIGRAFGKLWDKFHREHSGINESDCNKLAGRLGLGTAVILLLVTLMYILLTIFKII